MEEIQIVQSSITRKFFNVISLNDIEKKCFFQEIDKIFFFFWKRKSSSLF